MHETAGPWIVKPRDNMASIGVTLVRAIHGLDAALGKLDASEPFLVETFVDGEEINVEGVMLDGRAHVLSIARKTPYEAAASSRTVCDNQPVSHAMTPPRSATRWRAPWSAPA